MARSVELVMAMSYAKQNDYGTKLSDTDLTLSLPWKGEEDVKFKTDQESDADKFGKGHEFPEGQTIALTADTRLSKTFDGSSLVLGWVAGLGFGAVTTTELSPGAVYQHEFIPMNIKDSAVGKQLPATTFVEEKGDMQKRLFPDMVMGGFKITGEMKKQIEVAIEMVGSGYWEASTLSMPELAAGLCFLKTGDITFDYNGTNISAKLKNFEFEWKNTLNEDGGYVPGSQKLTFGNEEYQCRGECEVTRREISLKFKIKKEDLDIETDHLTLGQRSITLTATGREIAPTYNHKLEIVLPVVEIAEPNEVVDNGEYCYDVETRIKWDRGGINAPVKITVINDIPAYLTAAS